MFCSECGTKNEEGSMFCSNCGNKFEVEETKQKNTVKKETKPMSKKNKIICVVVLVVAVVLGVGYKVLDDKTSPKTIANDYIKARINNNTDKLYSYLNIDGDKTFISKKIFKEVMKDSNTSTSKIENYKITDVEKKDLSAVVKFTYTVKGSSSEKTASVNLVKGKDKKYFLFDDWKIGDLSTEDAILKDFKVKVLKGSKVTYAGIEVKDKYLSKEDSDKTYDVYVLPQVFKSKTKVSVELPSGMKIENDITPSTYRNSYTPTISESSLSEDAKKEIISSFKTILTDLYNDGIEGKKFADVESKYKVDGVKLDDLKKSYDEFVENLAKATNKLKSFKITDATLSSISLNEDGYYNVRVKVTFDYTIDYTNYSNETTSYDKSDYSYITLTLGYNDSKYYLEDIDNIKTYFSRY